MSPKLTPAELARMTGGPTGFTPDRPHWIDPALVAKAEARATTGRIYEFVVPCVPVPKARPRGTGFVRKGMLATQKGAIGVRMHTPPKTATFEAAVDRAARGVAFTLIDRPVRLSATFVLQRPATMTARKFGAGRSPHTKQRGDVDNFAKAVMDGCKAIWTDDALVYSLTAEKYYAAIGEAPHVQVRIEVLP